MSSSKAITGWLNANCPLMTPKSELYQFIPKEDKDPEHIRLCRQFEQTLTVSGVYLNLQVVDFNSVMGLMQRTRYISE